LKIVKSCGPKKLTGRKSKNAFIQALILILVASYLESKKPFENHMIFWCSRFCTNVVIVTLWEISTVCVIVSSIIREGFIGITASTFFILSHKNSSEIVFDLLRAQWKQKPQKCVIFPAKTDVLIAILKTVNPYFGAIASIVLLEL
jgi:hypothetical protein